MSASWNEGQFKKQFARVAELTIDATEKVVKQTTIELIANIMRDTPVDTGQLRGNWQVGIDAKPTGVFIGRLDPNGGATLNQMKQVINKFDIKKNNEIKFANNLPYFDIIEFGGHSMQAPQGMVRINVLRFDDMLKGFVNNHKLK